MWFLRNSWIGVSGALFAVALLAHLPLLAIASLLVFFAGGVARVWGHYAIRRVAYERQFEVTRAFQGEEIPFTLRLTNDKALPLSWVELTDQFPESLTPIDAHTGPSSMPGYVTFQRSTSLGWYERVTWNYRLRCGHRGFYRMGPALLRSGDLFGIFTTTAELSTGVDITIYPRLLDLEDLGFAAHRPFGEHRGAQLIFADPTSIRALRPYRAGDSLRQIDWKGTARRATLLSRQFEPAATHQILVALNADTMEHTWEGFDPHVLERAVSVAASVIRDALEDRFAAGLITNGSFPGSDRPIVIRPGRGPDQLTRVLEALAGVQPLTMKTLESSLAAATATIPAGSTVIVVAGLLPDGLVGSLLKLRDAGRRVEIVWVADAPPPELPLPLSLTDIGGELRGAERETTPATDVAGAPPPDEPLRPAAVRSGDDRWRRPGS